MSGFMPLLEAFLAFALTMAALTTAVSALVGTWEKLIRAPAYRLRMTLVYFFRNELIPFVGNLSIPAKTDEKMEGLQKELSQGDDAARTRLLAKFLVDATMLPNVVDRDKSHATSSDPDRREGITWLLVVAIVALLGALGHVISGVVVSILAWVALTATRSVRTNDNTPPADKEDERVTLLRQGITNPRWFEVTADGKARRAWGDRYRRWRSLGFCLDALPVSEFRTRFESSDIGRTLLGYFGAQRFRTELDSLASRYEVLISASVERSRRESHKASFLMGFVLAFAANIDSFNLLSVYMAKPDIVRQLIAKYEDSGKAEVKRADENQVAGSVAGLAKKLEELRSRRTALNNGPATDENVKKDIARIDEAIKDIEGAIAEVRTAWLDASRVVLGVTQTFPVGWDLYPNCAVPVVDLRCVRPRAAEGEPSGGAASARPNTSAGSKISVRCERYWTVVAGDCALFLPMADGVRGWAALLKNAWEANSGAFSRWLIGVLITGALLGLGTPFWNQVVTGVLATRNWLRSPTSSGPGGPQADGASTPVKKGT